MKKLIPIFIAFALFFSSIPTHAYAIFYPPYDKNNDAIKFELTYKAENSLVDEI